MVESEPGVTISLGRSFDWKRMAADLVEVTLQGTLTILKSVIGTDGTSNALSALVRALSKERFENNEQRAGALFRYGLALAFRDIQDTRLAQSEGYRETLEAALRAAQAAAEEKAETGAYILTEAFLHRPDQLLLYQQIRDALIAHGSLSRPMLVEARDKEKALAERGLRERFDIAFRRAVHEIWARDQDLFAPLYQALTAPGSKLVRLDHQWEAYRRSLVHAFEVEPVFGQEETRISLGQLYVPLRAVWREGGERETAAEDDTSGSQRRSSRQITHVVPLDGWLDDWIRDPKASHLRLIGGNPGSGKSSALKALARRLAAENDDGPMTRPLYIPLHHIRLDKDLREEVSQYFTQRSGSVFTEDPLARQAIEDGPMLVLLFDGLDELAVPGTAADDIANIFMSKLTQLTSELRGSGRVALRVVAAGRLPSFQAACKHGSLAGDRACEVVGLRPLRMLDQWRNWKGDDKPITADLRQHWWKGYTRAIGEPGAAPPPALTAQELEALTDEPLLCYLLALSRYLTDDWEQAAENRNRVYARLVNHVYDRDWASGEKPERRTPLARALSSKEFNLLMNTIALAAWHGGDTRVAHHSAFLAAAKILKTEACWERVESTSGADVANLAMTFYLKQADSDHRGFEFTHKSFGDYLAARALVTLGLRLRPWVEDGEIGFAMEKWLEAVATGIGTHEIVDFMRNEVRLRLEEQEGLDKIRGLKQALQKMANRSLRDGFPAHKCGCETWRAAEQRQRHAEGMLWALLNATARTLWDQDQENARIIIDQEQAATDRSDQSPKTALGDLIRRFGGVHNGTVYKSCLSHLHAEGASLPISDLHRSNLWLCNLANAHLEHAHLEGAHLEGARLEGARLKGANLERAHLDRAHLEHAHLEGAHLEGARLEGARLKGANLERAHLERAHLEHANLERANLEGAYLEGANLERAHLDCAHLEHANLEGRTP